MRIGPRARALGGAVIALLMFGCNAGPPMPVAKVWTARDFLAKQATELNFGGWLPRELLTLDGAPLRYQAGTQSGGPGLTIFPAVSDGQSIAFSITDIWQDHPQPWVQPVWIPLDENGDKVDGVRNVFPVDTYSTFYSPFWQARFLFTPGLTTETYRSSRDVLDAKVERRTGSVILCPIVDPEGTLFANDGSGTKNPATLAPVALPTRNAHAWVDRIAVTYLDFGPDRAEAYGQDVEDVEAYFFVTSAGERPLPLAAILPSKPIQHSLVRRVDVVLPEGSAPFVPSNRPELKALLEGRGLTVPMVPAALDAFPEFALRVVTDPSCFAAANFPAACTWLDTPERLEALQEGQVKLQLITQPVQLAIGVVVP